MANANEQPEPAGEDGDPIDLSKKSDTEFGVLDADSGKAISFHDHFHSFHVCHLHVDDSSSAESSMESDCNVPEPSNSLPGPQECKSGVYLKEEDAGQHLTGANCRVSCPSVPPPLIPVQPATHHIPFNHMSTSMHSNTWVPSWNQPPGICQFNNFYPMMLPPSPYQYQFNQFDQFPAQNVPNTHRFCPMNVNSFNHSFASNSMSHVPVPGSRFNQFPFQ